MERNMFFSWCWELLVLRNILSLNVNVWLLPEFLFSSPIMHMAAFGSITSYLFPLFFFFKLFNWFKSCMCCKLLSLFSQSHPRAEYEFRVMKKSLKKEQSPKVGLYESREDHSLMHIANRNGINFLNKSKL